MNNTNRRILAIVGPTATGKTIIGASLAKALNTEVISVDSQLVYQELSIGVAMPTNDEMLGVRHHMIGIVSPTTMYSAGDYASHAREIMERLLSDNKVPVLVGGTGFYLRSLLQPEHLPQISVDSALRTRLKKRLEAEGFDSLYNELRSLDHERASQLHPHDAKRVIRALEIIHTTKLPVPKTPQFSAYPIKAIGLTYADRQLHVSRIRQRLEAMVQQGFAQEAQQVYEKYGFCFALQNAHGYPEMVEVITGKRSLEDALDQIEINIRQYSKRQMTWFRKIPDIQWYYVDEMTKDEIITDVMKSFV